MVCEFKRYEILTTDRAYVSSKGMKFRHVPDGVRVQTGWSLILLSGALFSHASFSDSQYIV